MARRSVAVVAVAGALMALGPAAGAAGAAGSGPLARASLMGTYCGKVNIGYTNARAYGIGVTCTYARSVVRTWTSSRSGGPPPVISHHRGFRCRFGGTDLLLRLDCYRGAQVVRGRWGG